MRSMYGRIGMVSSKGVNHKNRRHGPWNNTSSRAIATNGRVKLLALVNMAKNAATVVTPKASHRCLGTSVMRANR